MTVVVSFVTSKALGAVGTQITGSCRIRENVTVPGTTSAFVQDGEIVPIGSGTVLPIRPAIGDKINIKAVT